jgi:murein DD-endopeptidase MepM/ murein hydrolase activator NlpD
VDRRTDSTLGHFMSEFSEQANGAAAAIATPDGRWALVSTFATALVAGAIAWLATGLIPNRLPQDISRSGLMPYQLFQQLVLKNGSYAPFSRSATLPTSRSKFSAFDGAQDAENARPTVETQTITLDSGDTLAEALTGAGFTAAEAQEAITALIKIFNPRGIHAGQTFELTSAAAEAAPQETHQITITMPNDSVSDQDDAADATVEPAAPEGPGKLLSIAFSPTIGHDITVTRGADGVFAASEVQQVLHAQYHRAGATIDSSLYLAAMQGGIPADIVVEMIRMFSYEVDFQRDIHPGDTFEVFYDTYYTPDGQPARQGEISYAAMKLNGRTVALYRYQPKGDEPADYFDAHGQSAKSMLMKTPVDGARISSGFGMRFHPVLGYTRMHKGIDFAVPVGTPVMAAGTGTIMSEGRSGGYGNFLLINHGNGYETAYGHLSRFASGLHQGARVRQGQVVAYSGNTGMSTGPHLHYEIRINDVQVNPTTVKTATGRKLMDNALRDFLIERLHVDAQLASMPLEARVADAASDLRAAKQ